MYALYVAYMTSYYNINPDLRIAGAHAFVSESIKVDKRTTNLRPLILRESFVIVSPMMTL